MTHDPNRTSTQPTPSDLVKTPSPQITREGKFWIVTMQQWLPLGPEDLFPFFADAFNLERITPPLLQFKVTTPPPIDMHTGTLIDYKLKINGLPVRWRTRIDAWDPPHTFIDEQLKGPYVRWHHTHTFEPAAGPRGEAGTLCKDRVEYRPPGGPLAPLINRIFVQNDVQAIFEHRGKVLDQLYNNPDADGGAGPT